MRFLEPEMYQPRARAVYETVATQLRALLPDALIEHIGSSAIAGAISKGDLDVFVAVSRDKFSEAIAAIESCGFRIKSNTLRTDQLCPFESDNYALDVGIQLVERGSHFEFFRRFRDLMNADPWLRDRYNQLKREAEPLDEQSYRVLKSDFIEAVLAQTDPSLSTSDK
ncbi:MAG TPA: GrpB family protein [Thermoanaerobaculia bacterium]